MKKQNKNQGSVTIEATIGLTAFVFVIVAILTFINICRAQMIVSLAVDSTAKEMSEYAYFYGISGLQSVADTLKDKAANGKEQTNELVGYTMTMFEGLGDLKGNAEEAKAAVSNFQPKSFETAISDINSTASTMSDIGTKSKANAEKIVSAAKSFGSSIKDMDIGAYLKSMGAFAANEGYHAILSKLICPALAKALIGKHFAGYSESGDVDEALKSIGISDGMDGLNFYMSEMFGEDNPTQIHLVCYYTLELNSLIDLPGDGRMMFCKESVTNAWLNGFSKKGIDESSEDAKPSETPSSEESSEEESSEEESSEEPETPEHLKTGIDSMVTDTTQQALGLADKQTFANGEYRTVVTDQPITVYVYFGENIEFDQSYATSASFSTERQAREQMAILPENESKILGYVAVTIPAGTTLNIGTSGSQEGTDGRTLSGGADRIMLPANCYDEHPDWYHLPGEYMPETFYYDTYE